MKLWFSTANGLQRSRCNKIGSPLGKKCRLMWKETNPIEKSSEFPMNIRIFLFFIKNIIRIDSFYE